jgi:hypothetical protein
MGLLRRNTDEDVSPAIRQVASPLPRRLRPLGPRCDLVQFSSLLTDADFRRLARFLEAYPSVTLRAYGGYDGSIRNLDWLRHFPTLRRLQVDALYELDDISGLQHLPEDLEDLGLGQTRKRLSLAQLGRFPRLRRLYLEGHTKDIEVVSGLTQLVDVTLRSITLPDLSLLLPLRELRVLDLKLGGTRNLDLLPELAPLRYLEIWQVRGLSDLEPVGEVVSLEELYLQALKNVTALPGLGRMTSLRWLHLETMKGLFDLNPLRDAPALEQVRLIDMPHLQPEDLAPLVEHPTLRAATIGLGSLRRNDRARQLVGLPADDWKSTRGAT